MSYADAPGSDSSRQPDETCELASRRAGPNTEPDASARRDSVRTGLARSRQPLPIAIAFALGIALATLVPAARPVGMLAAIVSVLASARDRRWVPAVAIAMGLVAGARPAPRAPASVTIDDRTSDRVVGLIAGPIVPTAHGTGARLDTDDGGAIWLWLDRETALERHDTRASLIPGMRVVVTGRAKSPGGSRGPGMVVPRGKPVQMTIDTIAIVEDAAGPVDRAWRWARETQIAWSERVESAGGEATARAALRGIVTGDRSAVPPELDARWRATGIFHVLSVSGLHLAVIAGLAFLVLRKLVAASPLGRRVNPARWAAPPAMVIAVVYTLVTGAQLATLRALIVVGLVLVAAMIDRPLRLIDALGVAAIAILVWHPSDLFDPSFQLSFTATIVLALVRRPIATGVKGWIARGVATSFWITIATAPLTAYHFHQVTPSGIVGNLVLTPLLELVALPIGLLGIALGSIGAPLVRIATEIVGVVDHAAALGAEVAIVGRVAIASSFVLVVLVAISLALVVAKRRALGWVVLCAIWTLARAPAPAGALRVTFLDVGQGDAAIVELPDGGVWLVDAGGHASAGSLARASATGAIVERALASAGHDRVDIAIVSHPHPDHYAGLAGMTVPIGEVWSAREVEAGEADRGSRRAFAGLVDTLVARGTRAVSPPLGVAARRAGVELVVWAPRYQPIEGGAAIAAADPVRSVNDNSLVVEVRFANRSIVFAGDLELEGEDLVVAAGLGRADVVKVAHHGSPTSSSIAFVEATAPEIAVVSCGRGNMFGFPSADVVARWRASGAEILRTDLLGAVTVTVDSAGVLAVDR
ncbi:MAG: DNA internalization-related competence protein ComEC/Rec2 [Kofleriaceae bacterium]